MQKYYRLIFVVFSVFSIIFSNSANAVSSVLISQVQPGYSENSTEEFVEIYNNTPEDIDITNWCLYYSSANSLENGTEMKCFETNFNTYVFLSAHSTAFAVSNEINNGLPFVGFSSDLIFNLALSDDSGHVRLLDNNKKLIDKVGWGDATSPENSSAKRTIISNVFQRKSSSPNTLQDSDNNLNDFIEQEKRPIYEIGGIYEVVDLCPNLTGIQEVIPSELFVDSNGDCVAEDLDLCSNIVGSQNLVPTDMYSNGDGDCLFIDVCLNLPGNQNIVPNGYDVSGGSCVLNILPIQITEILPNADGVDDGNEFIELYNPNNVDIDLSKYILKIATPEIKEYTFTDGLIIKPDQYFAIYNSDIKFTLLNTSSLVSVSSIDNTFLNEAEVYEDPKEGFSWSLINNIWQYTNNITPGYKNISQDPVNLEVINSLQDCGPGQYRNAETNRCRNIVVATSTLVPCKDGQYRSEETGRCRNITSDISSLSACKEGEERNPETNRCRKISAVLGNSTLKPCDEGEERNPETNRCRKVTSSVPEVDYKPEVVSQKSDNKVLWFSLIGVLSAAIFYAIWEWRKEIVKLTKKFRSFIHFQK